MSSSETESEPKIHEGLSISELISVLRNSYQKKEFDEVERLLIVRDEKLQAERDHLKMDCNRMKENFNLLEKKHGILELDRLSIEQELKSLRCGDKESRQQLNRLKGAYKILECRLRKEEATHKVVVEKLNKVETEKKIEGSKLAEELMEKNKEFEKLTKAEVMYKAVAEELKNVETEKKIEGNKLAEELMKKNKEIEKLTKAEEAVTEQLKRVETEKKIEGNKLAEELMKKNKEIEKLTKAEEDFTEELKKVKTEKKVEGNKLAEELMKKNKVIEKLMEENDLLYGILRRDGKRMSKLEEDVAKICGFDVLRVREGVCDEDVDVDVVIERIRRMTSLSDNKEELHERADGGLLGSENADLNVEMQQDSSDENLKKTTVETLSNGCCEVVSPRSDIPLILSAVAASSSANITGSEASWDPELNVETSHSNEPDASLVRITNRPLSPIYIVISDTEDEILPARKRRKTDFVDSGVHDDDVSSESDVDSTGFESYLENKFAKLRRYKENGWKSAADMLSAFEKDYEPCMNAICALYRKKFPATKSKKSKNSNFDPLVPGDQALFHFEMSGKALAEYLIDGDPQQKLKKTVLEVQKEAPELLSQCKDLAIRYHDILFDMYARGKDRHFRPEL